MDCSLPGSSIHGIFQARVLEWGAIAFSSHLHTWSYWYFSWQSWFQLVLHPAQHFTWYTPIYKLSKQGDDIQPWCTPLLIWNQSVIPCTVITVASWPEYRFLRRKVRGSGISHLLKNFPQIVVIHTVKGFGLINKAEVDIFLELSCFFYDPTDMAI